jgi:hypothetical protein
MVSPQNAPRTLEGLLELSRAVRYRLALNMELVSAHPEADSTKAFLTEPPHVQAQTLLDALYTLDNNGGAQSPQNAMAQVTPMQPSGHVLPAPAPGQMQPMQPPQPMQQQLPPTPARQPSTLGDPNNAGSLSAPKQAEAGVSADIAAKILKELEACAGIGETDELKDLQLASIRLQRIILMLCLEVAENTLGMDKATIISMVAASSVSGEIEVLLKQVEGGKG